MCPRLTVAGFAEHVPPLRSLSVREDMEGLVAPNPLTAEELKDASRRAGKILYLRLDSRHSLFEHLLMRFYEHNYSRPRGFSR